MPFILLRCLLLCACLLCLPSAVQASAVPVAKEQRLPQPQKPAARRGACVLLAFLLPPLAVYVWQDRVVTRWFWWALVLMLFFLLPGILYAIFVISK